jgi:hypothetical protein
MTKIRVSIKAKVKQLNKTLSVLHLSLSLCASNRHLFFNLLTLEVHPSSVVKLGLLKKLLADPGLIPTQSI